MSKYVQGSRGGRLEIDGCWSDGIQCPFVGGGGELCVHPDLKPAREIEIDPGREHPPWCPLIGSVVMVAGPKPAEKGSDDMEQHGIGWAVKQLQEGQRVCRPGWNGKNMYLELQRPDEHSKMTQPYVYICIERDGDTGRRTELVPWLCSQTDLLATDWQLA